MILRELYYQNPEEKYTWDQTMYEPEHDESPLATSDTRKTRLTLMQINRIRKASDLHVKQKSNELEFIRQMYGTPPEAAGGGLM